MQIPPHTPGHHAARHPDRAAIVTEPGSQVVTYGELESRSARLARALREAGLRPGDHIALLLDNRAAMLELAWAAQRSGLYYTPVNTRLSGDEAAYVVDDCGATVLFAAAAVSPLAAEVRASAPRVTRFVAVDGPIDGFETLSSFVDGVTDEPLDDECEGSPMLYSSGTTGRPKGVRRLVSGQPYGTENPVGPLLDGVMGFGPGEVYLTPAPLYHSRAAGVVDDGAPQRRDPGADGALRRAGLSRRDRPRTGDARAVRAHHVRAHAEAPRRRAGRVRRVEPPSRRARGRAPCPVEVKRRMIEWWGPIVSEYYAGTEGGGLTWIGSTEWLEHPGSVGRAAWGEIHICAESGEELPVGEPGIVRFGGGANEFEYHNDPEKTRQTFDQHAAGARCGTSGTSIPTATCTSPIASPT